MSVLIKGMKMPKNCLVCLCTDTEYGECVLDPEKRCPEDYKKRADWCPFCPVPEHGRLGDLDKLEQMFSDIDHAPYSGFDGTEPFILPKLQRG